MPKLSAKATTPSRAQRWRRGRNTSGSRNSGAHLGKTNFSSTFSRFHRLARTAVADVGPADSASIAWNRRKIGLAAGDGADRSWKLKTGMESYCRWYTRYGV